MTGQFLTKATIWLNLAAYAVSVITFSFSRGRRRWDSLARLAWTAACASLIAHVAFAYDHYYGWSHAAAYSSTARQTEEMFGVDWGGGLYINYLVLVVWILDVAWWWRGLDTYRRRPWFVGVAWNAFLIFIIFNATVVFGAGVIRWLGLIVCLGLCLIWWLTSNRHSELSSSKPTLVVSQD